MSKIAAAASTNAKPIAKMSVASLNQPAERPVARYPASNTSDRGGRGHRQRKLPVSHPAARCATRPTHNADEDRRANRGERPARARDCRCRRSAAAQSPAAQRRRRTRSPSDSSAEVRNLREQTRRSRSRGPAGRSTGRTAGTRGAREVRHEPREHEQPVHDQPRGYEIEPHDLRTDARTPPSRSRP